MTAGVYQVIALITLKILQKFTAGRARSLVCLKGKTAIVTGGTSGIGYETALVLASRGARVIIADRKDGTKVKQQIIDITQNEDIETKILDLSSLQSVRRFAKEINETEERLDILINNAGTWKVTNKHSDDGLHETMQVNHFGPFLLTHLLSGLLKKSAPSRIIFVNSAYAFCSNLSLESLNPPQGHPMTFLRNSLIYANSKLANIITANGFAERLKEFGVTSNSLHPGLSIEEGAQTTIHLALSKKLKDVTGRHFWDCRVFPMPPGAWNKKFSDDVWEASEKLVQLKPEEKI
ncbi:unnamed protein product [Acanthoscelides obtectus]|uniref:NAD(P)-binding protein n=1 Tax=Acanthoscelides obtectus TaxID=200917 RepID=A0A9P0M6B5_ACAOB|nr:unnamed protein product [Acanthoscelides obtectus]CAK1658278.1 Dehydrogenase/reductase SDR family member 13 [Acanthoscelides obtectus]